MTNLKQYRIKPGKPVSLDDYDPDDTGGYDDKRELKKKTEKLVQRLSDLQELLYAEHKHKVLVILQGMDTSGKDGTVRHVMDGFNAQGVRVASFKKPTEPELERDYLWRVHAQVPAKGEVVVFNRSHYEDVLVVRVHDLVPEAEWRQRYAQINEFERMLTETGTLILKFFLHISRDEQKKRLEERISDPTKRWKFQHGDIEERKLWNDYEKAYEDALQQTSTKWAPWYVVPANAKWYRNHLVATVIAEAMDGLDMKFPEPDLTGVVIE
jgi:PPK2 family polyphosphate:nucleotide phosphotransferase